MSNIQRIDFVKKPLISGESGNQAVDLANGYLRLANQIQDALCRVELSGREFRVLNAVIRLTYGWSKKEDRLTNSLLAEASKLSIKHVSEAVVSLSARRIILLRRLGQTRYIGINTYLDQWIYGKPGGKAGQFNTEKNITHVITIPETREGKNRPKTVPENRDNHPQNQGKSSLKTGNTKDIYPDTKNNKTTKRKKLLKPDFDPCAVIPDWLNSRVWEEWCQYRKESGKPITTQLTVTKAFDLLHEYLVEGHDPVDVINSSIANGYQGLFRPKFALCKQITASQEQAVSHWNDRKEWEDNFI